MPEPPEAGQDEPEQIVLMQRMVDLAIERTQQSADRSRMSADRSEMSADRSRMSAERSEMSAERSYMNAERTLSVWIRTALAAMVVGMAIDRLRIFLLEDPMKGAKPDTASSMLGTGLVALGVLMTVSAAVRFRLYAKAYRRKHELPQYHGAFMAPAFALLVGVFGIILLVLLIVVTD